MSENKINILIVDDSRVVTQLLQAVFMAHDDLNVIGIARNGEEAVTQTRQLRPDIITMDIEMPVLNGIEATKTIMDECPTPIIVISGKTNRSETDNAFDAINAGALTVFEKPQDIVSESFAKKTSRLVSLIRSLAGIKVIRRRSHLYYSYEQAAEPTLPKINGIEIIGIGASTGGPEVLSQIFSNLPVGELPPIVTVLHITDGFLPGLVSWLEKMMPLPVHIAQHGMLLQRGNIYFAPNHYQLTVTVNDDKIYSLLDKDLSDNRFIPSVDVLFHSLAQRCQEKAVGCLLTGMGSDGAEGLLAMHQAGCETIIQSERSSTVFGMPGRAKQLNAATYELSPVEISQLLATLNQSRGVVSCQSKF